MNTWENTVSQDLVSILTIRRMKSKPKDASSERMKDLLLNSNLSHIAVVRS